jgi:hypothetical protein
MKLIVERHELQRLDVVFAAANLGLDDEARFGRAGDVLAHELRQALARHERARAARREDVPHGIAVSFHLRERLRRIHRHGDDACRQAAHERQDELVRLGQDERDAIAFLQAELEERACSLPSGFPQVRKADPSLLPTSSNERDGAILMNRVLAKDVDE